MNLDGLTIEHKSTIERSPILDELVLVDHVLVSPRAHVDVPAIRSRLNAIMPGAWGVIEFPFLDAILFKRVVTHSKPPSRSLGLVTHGND